MSTEYTIDPEDSFVNNILKVYEMHMKNPFNHNNYTYINPNLLGEILEKLDTYSPLNEESVASDEIWEWVRGMYGV